MDVRGVGRTDEVGRSEQCWAGRQLLSVVHLISCWSVNSDSCPLHCALFDLQPSPPSHSYAVSAVLTSHSHSSRGPQQAFHCWIGRR